MSKPPTKRCKNCKWLDVKLDSAERRVVRSGHVYRCGVPFVLPQFPDCVSIHTYRRSLMEGHQGTDCPTFSPLETKP